jgi:hypothetical protein
VLRFCLKVCRDEVPALMRSISLAWCTSRYLYRYSIRLRRYLHLGVRRGTGTKRYSASAQYSASAPLVATGIRGPEGGTYSMSQRANVDKSRYSTSSPVTIAVVMIFRATRLCARFPCPSRWNEQSSVSMGSQGRAQSIPPLLDNTLTLIRLFYFRLVVHR